MEDWMEEFPGAVTVTDHELRITYVNAKAAAAFEKEGGKNLVGSDLLACHKPRSNEIIKRILETGEPNVYTIEKKGVKKFIYQSPWREEGQIAGLVELSIEIPFDLPHFLRG
jgi:transcriptional regulator with PAS, ATPase and Fis domain